MHQYNMLRYLKVHSLKSYQELSNPYSNTLASPSTRAQGYLRTSTYLSAGGALNSNNSNPSQNFDFLVWR